MNTDQDRQQAHQRNQHDHDRLAGAESPRELLAVHDPSKQAAAHGRQTASRGHGVTVQWVKPTELAARIAARTTAGAVAAHSAAHHQVRENIRARLAPLSAFGCQAQSGPVTVDRSVVGC